MKEPGEVFVVSRIEFDGGRTAGTPFAVAFTMDDAKKCAPGVVNWTTYLKYTQGRDRSHVLYRIYTVSFVDGKSQEVHQDL